MNNLKKSQTKPDHFEVMELVKLGYSKKSISDHLGCSVRTVFNVIERNKNA